MRWMPSLEEQVAAMSDAWPTLQVVEQDDRQVVWRGTLRPLVRAYEVQVLLRAPLVIETINAMKMQPEVRVTKPLLEPRDEDSEGPLPHVYWDHPEMPMLCLFDPAGDEWSPTDLIAETTVRWAVDWLACYEGWRATGKWAGGGRHASYR